MNIKKDEHIFYHPIFRADNKFQLHTIKRKRKGKDGMTQDIDSRLRAEILKQEEIKTSEQNQHFESQMKDVDYQFKDLAINVSANITNTLQLESQNER